MSSSSSVSSPPEAVSDKENLYPHAAELIVGAVAFAIIFFFMWKWVHPAGEHAPRGAPRRRSRARWRRPRQRTARPTRS